MSLALHIGLLALLFFARDRVFDPLPEAPIEVDIVDAIPVPAEAAAPPASAPALAPAIPAAPAPPAAAGPEPPQVPAGEKREAGPVRAQRMLGAAAMAEPRNRQIRRVMPTLAPEEQERQLCALEALAQIAVWDAAFKPEKVIAYALQPLVGAAGRVVARGAAVLSHGQWFRLSYACAIQARPLRVNAFEFEVGPAIPRAQWAAYNLPAH